MNSVQIYEEFTIHWNYIAQASGESRLICGRNIEKNMKRKSNLLKKLLASFHFRHNKSILGRCGHQDLSICQRNITELAKRATIVHFHSHFHSLLGITIAYIKDDAVVLLLHLLTKFKRKISLQNILGNRNQQVPQELCSFSICKWLDIMCVLIEK